jgi:hypothetical protein
LIHKLFLGKEEDFDPQIIFGKKRRVLIHKLSFGKRGGFQEMIMAS